MKRLRRALDLALAALFLVVIAPALLTPHRLTVAAFGWTGRVLLPLLPFAARVRDNLRHVRPGATSAQARALTSAVGDNGMRVVAEYIQMRSFARRSAARRVTGLEHLRAAIAAGRGVVLVGAHYGSWEAVRLAARDAGVEVGIMTRAFNNAAFDAMVMLRLGLAGEPVLRKGPDGVLALLRLLRGGGAVMILLDQRLGYGPPLPFLGQPAQTTSTVAALARRIGAPLIPAYARRAPDGASFDVVFEAPVTQPDPTDAMREINARIGAWIDAEPGQWFWLHRRWKYAGG